MSERSHLIHEIGNNLFDATVNRQAIKPVREALPDATLNDAYAIQTVQLERHLAEGKVLAGHKIGLTSLAMQQQLGVDSPDFGFFTEDMVYLDGSLVPVNRFISPKVEPELGFKLKKDLTGSNISIEEALEAVEAVYPAIEIIDSRVENWDIRLVDTVADNASCGAIVLGSQPLEVDFANLTTLGCSLAIDGETKESGTGTDVMGHPVAPLAWLAGVLHEQGTGLKAGQVVLTGSFTKALPVVAGESVTADYGEYGTMSLKFI